LAGLLWRGGEPFSLTNNGWLGTDGRCYRTTAGDRGNFVRRHALPQQPPDNRRPQGLTGSRDWCLRLKSLQSHLRPGRCLLGPCQPPLSHPFSPGPRLSRHGKSRGQQARQYKPTSQPSTERLLWTLAVYWIDSFALQHGNHSPVHLSRSRRIDSLEIAHRRPA